MAAIPASRVPRRLRCTCASTMSMVVSRRTALWQRGRHAILEMTALRGIIEPSWAVDIQVQECSGPIPQVWPGSDGCDLTFRPPLAIVCQRFSEVHTPHAGWLDRAARVSGGQGEGKRAAQARSAGDPQLTPVVVHDFLAD